MSLLLRRSTRRAKLLADPRQKLLASTRGSCGPHLPLKAPPVREKGHHHALLRPPERGAGVACLPNGELGFLGCPDWPALWPICLANQEPGPPEELRVRSSSLIRRINSVGGVEYKTFHATVTLNSQVCLL